MNAFVYEAHPARVVFGAGRRSELKSEAERLGLRRIFLITPARYAEEASANLGVLVAALDNHVVMHVPIEIAAAARAAATGCNADGIVAFGGGSAVGLAKSVALTSGLPILCVPGTFAGSEMTEIWGVTEAGEKRTGRDAKVRPRTVIYDPELLQSLPTAIAGPSGLNAIAHAMEALYAVGTDPITLLMAEESVRGLARALPRVVGERVGHDEALYGAWLAGACLDRAAMGLHHKLCHVLGGSFALPHAAVHAVILPYVAKYNRDAAPVAMARLARALGADDAPAGLRTLAEKIHAPLSLSALGMKHGDLDRAADLVMKAPYANPRPVDRTKLRQLLEEAFAGTF